MCEETSNKRGSETSLSLFEKEPIELDGIQISVLSSPVSLSFSICMPLLLAALSMCALQDTFVPRIRQRCHVRRRRQEGSRRLISIEGAEFEKKKYIESVIGNLRNLVLGAKMECRPPHMAVLLVSCAYTHCVSMPLPSRGAWNGGGFAFSFTCFSHRGLYMGRRALLGRIDIPSLRFLI